MQFTYNALQTDDEFRILELLPKQGDGTICGRLHSAVIGHSRPYEALSYCWGLARMQDQLLIEGRELPVTASLAVALRLLQHEKESRFIWVDQICINQNDIKEKSSQVQNLMGRIYTDTAALFIWLGEADETSSLAISTVNRACAEIEQNGGICSFHKADLSYVSMRNKDGQIDLGPWLAVRTLLARPWFTRTWVPSWVGMNPMRGQLAYSFTGYSGAVPPQDGSYHYSLRP